MSNLERFFQQFVWGEHCLACTYWKKYCFQHHIFILKFPRVALAQPQLPDSLTHTHTFTQKYAKRGDRLTDVQSCRCLCTHYSRTQPDMPDAKVRKWRLLPCGVPIRMPFPALLPLLRTHSICSALINQGRGGQGVATWNKAWSSHGVLQTTSWHLAKLFLSCVLPIFPQGYTAC